MFSIGPLDLLRGLMKIDHVQLILGLVQIPPDGRLLVLHLKISAATLQN
jgi:hypothetical protein